MSDVLDRIDAKIDKSAGADGCWMWTGSVGQKGGPTTSIRKKHANPRRLIWEHIHGEALPKTRQVSTSCEEPRCLNPAHLYLRPWCDDEARFWTHVNKDGPILRPELGPCWIWTSTFFQRGYGGFKMKGKERQAHRVAYELTYGPIEGHVPGHPELERVVMHKCDNPRCVRPEHLEIGTDKDNIADMWAKGRGSRGPAHAAACAAGKQRASR